MENELVSLEVAIIRRAPSTEAQSLRDQCVILDLKDGSYYTLGETGRFIWEQFDGRKRLVEIVPMIVDQFEIDARTAMKDLMEFVEELRKCRLIHLE